MQKRSSDKALLIQEPVRHIFEYVLGFIICHEIFNDSLDYYIGVSFD